MKRLILLVFTLQLYLLSFSQTYYPPLTGSTWATTDPATLGWCSDSINQLYDYLESSHSKAFIILKNGKIVLEKYFGTFTKDSLWIWNSAGKTLTGFSVGIAQKEGYLDISDTTSDYLGQGWTSLTPQQEEKITIRHQLTMTSGLDDGVPDIYCTDPACLQYKADPGTRWAYHNAPYTLLDSVIESSTGLTLNQWVAQKIKSKTGMTGQYYKSGYNNIFVSTPRSMARFGLLLLSQGSWNGTIVLDDPQYFHDMTNSSQTINPAYGYLTWLNGKSTYRVPGSQVTIPGKLLPSAPSDLFAALGKDGQIINVIPSQGLVVIRMGNDDGNSLVTTQYNDTIWQYINRLSCVAGLNELETLQLSLSPNPSENGQAIVISNWKPADEVVLYTTTGQVVESTIQNGTLYTHGLSPGIYLVTIDRSGIRKTLRLVVN